MEVSDLVGSGFSFLQSRLSILSENEYDTIDSNDQHLEQQPTVLSESAKGLLMNLLKQENVNLTYHHTYLSIAKKANDSTKQQQRQQILSKMKIILPGMTDETKLNLAYHHEISLLGSILYIIDQNHQIYNQTAASVTTNTGSSTGIGSTAAVVGTSSSSSSTITTTIVSGSVSTKSILQQCAYTVIPQKTPALLSAREMVCAALHCLCQEYPNPTKSSSSISLSSTTERTARIQLPLIQSTSMSSDIERRSYEKAYDWNFKTILPQILQLEHEFYNNAIIIIPSASTSDNSKNSLMWLPRELFIPDIKDDELLRRIYIQGSIPSTTNDGTSKKQSTTGSKKGLLEKSSSKTTSKNLNNTTGNTKSSDKSGVTKSINIKCKQPSLSTTKSKKNLEVDPTQRSGHTIKKKIKITLSSNKNSLTHRDDTTTTMPPTNRDYIMKAETNPAMAATGTMFDEDDEDSVQFD